MPLHQTMPTTCYFISIKVNKAYKEKNPSEGHLSCDNFRYTYKFDEGVGPDRSHVL